MKIFSLRNIATIATLFTVAGSCKENEHLKFVNEAPSCLNYAHCDVPSTCSTPTDIHIENLLAVLAKSNSSGSTIIETYLSSCFNSNNTQASKAPFISQYFYEWTTEIDPEQNSTNPQLDTLVSSETIVHEVSHALTHALSGPEADCCEGEVQQTYFLNSGETVLVPYTKSVNAQAIIPLVAREVKEMGVLYEAYIEKGSHASNVFGIYALLDEFHAFYQGSTVAFGYYDHLIDLYRTTGDDLYLKALSFKLTSSIQPYYEFKYYQLLYLSYLKKNHQDIYQATMQNQQFWKVFSHTDEQYGKLVQETISLLENDPQLSPYLEYYQGINWYFDFLKEETEKIEWQ